MFGKGKAPSGCLPPAFRVWSLRCVKHRIGTPKGAPTIRRLPPPPLQRLQLLVPKNSPFLPSYLPSTALDGKYDGKYDGNFYRQFHHQRQLTTDMMTELTTDMTTELTIKPAVLSPRCPAERLTSSGLHLPSRWTRSSRCKSGASGGSCGALTPRFFRVFFAPLRIASKRLLRTT